MASADRALKTFSCTSSTSDKLNTSSDGSFDQMLTISKTEQTSDGTLVVDQMTLYCDSDGNVVEYQCRTEYDQFGNIVSQIGDC